MLRRLRSSTAKVRRIKFKLGHYALSAPHATRRPAHRGSPTVIYLSSATVPRKLAYRSRSWG
jgi:hypothetical protein